MAETTRDKTAALALLPLGQSTPACTLQDLRDIVHSLYDLTARSYGEIGFTTPAATTLVQGAWTKAAGATTLGTASGLDMPTDNRLRNSGTSSVVYEVAADLSLMCGDDAQQIEVGISTGGADPATDTIRSVTVGTGSSETPLSVRGFFSLAALGYVELWVRNTTSTATITIETCNLTAVKVG